MAGKLLLAGPAWTEDIAIGSLLRMNKASNVLLVLENKVVFSQQSETKFILKITKCAYLKALH